MPSTNGKSTEHNIDTYAFFTMLAALTHGGKADNGASWTSLAEHALAFVIAMYNTAAGYFYTGTLGDQITINTYPIPEDCQTWSYLALLDNQYKHTIDWALANLQTTDTASAPNSSLTGNQKITGLNFDTASFAPTFPVAIRMRCGSRGLRIRSPRWWRGPLRGATTCPRCSRT